MMTVAARVECVGKSGTEQTQMTFEQAQSS